MKYLVRVLVVLGVLLLATAVSSGFVRASDTYVRNRVLLLHSKEGSCTGVEVIAPSGKVYTLTAAHCRKLISGNKMFARDEQGKDHVIKFLAEDPFSDLMLMTSAMGSGIRIANKVHQHQHVHTMTHGKGMPSYRTDGEILSIRQAMIPLYEIESEEMMRACNSPKNTVLWSGFGMDCALSVKEMMATAATVPGSSGGPLLNSQGELVGIVSAGGENVVENLFVTIPDIKSFLKNR